MPIFKLSKELQFPPASFAREDGLLAFGGKLEPQWIIEAYSRGIFPWFNADEPILWWSPNPRSVLFIDEIKISKSMKKIMKKEFFTISFDKNFKKVMENCANSREETWISKKIIKTYTELHEMGVAHSVEVWREEKLVGGLYGISLGKMFFGESMFSLENNASKIALIKLCEYLKDKNYILIDCQVHNSHLESMGAKEIKREEFLELMQNQIQKPTEYKKWQNKNQCEELLTELS